MLTTFGLLGLSIISVWLPDIQLKKNFTVPPWLLLFLCAIASGVLAGYLNWIAISTLTLFLVTSYLATRSNTSFLQKFSFNSISILAALLFAMHLIPGFNNPILIANINFSDDSSAFTQYANFDKGAAGLILLVFFCNRVKSFSELISMLRRAYSPILITITGVIVTGISIGYIKPDIKLHAFTPIFLTTNLFFTCIAEEAFFRGFLQDRLTKKLSSVRFGGNIAIFISGIVFGAAHFAGGSIYVMLATLAGLGYAYAYAVTQKIEIPILTHFIFNAVHFIGFSYPHIQ
jgi:membrane protease YdiL (CAAX protease family)